MKKVLLIGAQGMDNLGDDYMYGKITSFLHENNCLVYSSDIKTNFYFENLDDKNTAIQIPVLKYRNKVDLICKIVKEYIENTFDAVIFIGGGYTNDYFGFHWLMQLLLVTLAYKKSKIIFTGQTVGPVFSKRSEMVLKALYRQADFISTRDDRSHRILKTWGIENKLIGDDAFLDEEYKLNACEKKKGFQKKVIIVPKAFPGYEKYVNNFNRIVISMLKDQKIEDIRIIPFRSDSEDLEYKICVNLNGILNSNGYKTQLIKCKTIAELEQEMKRCDLLIGSAYHSVTLGLKYGCDVFALYTGDYYETKMKGILSFYNLEKTNCINMASDEIVDAQSECDSNRVIKKSIDICSSVCAEWNDIIRMI